MNPIIDSLNRNAGVLSLMFGAVVALATVFYAKLTSALVAETKRMRQAHTEPQLLVHVEVSPVWVNFINISVRNIGGGPAYGVNLKLDRDIVPDQGSPLSSWGPFKHGLKFLAPGQVHTRFLLTIVDQLSEIEDPGGKYAVTATATYTNALGESHRQEFPLDFMQFVGLTTIGTPADQEIAKSLKTIQQDFARLVSGRSKLKVDSFTSLDRIQKRMEWERIVSESRQRTERRDEPPPSGPAEPVDQDISGV